MIDVSSFCFIHAVVMILWTLCEDSTKDQIELGSKGDPKGPMKDVGGV